MGVNAYMIRKGRAYITGVNWDTGKATAGRRENAVEFRTVEEAVAFGRTYGIRAANGWKLVRVSQ